MALFALVSISCAITKDDEAALKQEAQPSIDNDAIVSASVSVTPPDKVMYIIEANSNSETDKFAAQLTGLILFSRLTYNWPEVTSGVIMVCWKPPMVAVVSDLTDYEDWIDVYSSDLSPIEDRANPTVNELSQVYEIIDKRIKRGEGLGLSAGM